MMELLAPAGGYEALIAAVQSGADAVYMGFGAFNARRSAKNFTDEEFASAVDYCHLRGVRVFLTLNTLLTDRELVQAADAISAARPGARRENLENYIKRLEQLESIATSFQGVEKAYAIQAGREIRIMVKPEEVSEDQMVLLARDIAKKIEDELTYPGQIKVHVLRETKAVDYAK